MINGCDVSHFHGKQIDFNKMKAAGAQFVYIKATDFDVNNGVDDCFYQNMVKAKTAGLLFGVYHRWRPDSKYGVSEQIALFYSIVGDLFDLPPALEVNEGGNPRVLWTTRLYAMLNTAEKYFQRRPIIFTSLSIWKTHANNYDWPPKYPLWITHYKVDTPKIPLPWEKWTIWQYSNKGNGEQYGINKYESQTVNLDYFNGTLAELKAL